MKKLTVICCITALSLAMAACGKKTEETVAPETEVLTETAEETNVPEETEESAATENEVKESEEVEASSEADTMEETAAEENAAAEDEAQASGGYEDNFAVDSAAAAEYAGKIKTAVAEQNLEALADLAAYPVYVGFADGGTSVKSKEEMLALGAERVFTPEMMESIAGADESTLSPSMAGFALSKDGRPNIIFGVVEGNLAIVGMNY